MPTRKLKQQIRNIKTYPYRTWSPDLNKYISKNPKNLVSLCDICARWFPWFFKLINYNRTFYICAKCNKNIKDLRRLGYKIYIRTLKIK